jgi:hypothetical protein
MQPTKCVIWSPHGLDHSISLRPGFFILDFDFRILGGLVGFRSFIESFVIKALHEDLGMIFCLPMLANLQVAFTMLSLCYTQCAGYLFHTMFPSPCILQQYVEFNTYTIVMLEKILNVGSFVVLLFT